MQDPTTTCATLYYTSIIKKHYSIVDQDPIQSIEIGRIQHKLN